MPPMKKYKPVNSKPQEPNSTLHRPLGNGFNIPNGIHATVMNGPTLTPQGQIQTPPSSYSGNEEQSFLSRKSYPELASPPDLKPTSGHPAYTNGSAHDVNNNHFVPQLPPQPFQSPYANPSPHAKKHQPQHVGWSARYTPPQQTQPQQNYVPPAQSRNPFANSFDRQRPSSSHSTQNVPSPNKKVPSPSPSQPTASTPTPSYNPTSETNGISPHQPLPPTGPPAYSPVKQTSPKTAPPIGHHPSSSPIAHQPELQANGASSPGFSPTKRSPPRQLPPGHTITGTPAVLPPAPQLSPSPRQQGPDAAALSISSEQLKPVNGQMN